MKKILSIVTILILLIGVGFIYFKYYFEFGEGVKAGQLNYFVKKGIIFKTYEGKLIQAGFRSKNTSGTIQSYEFQFSVEDEAVAQQLMNASGDQVELHYKEYNGTLPWRGFSNYIVDKVVAIESQ